MLNRKLNSNTIILQSRKHNYQQAAHSVKGGAGRKLTSMAEQQGNLFVGPQLTEKEKVSLVNLSSQICVHTA